MTLGWRHRLGMTRISGHKRRFPNFLLDQRAETGLNQLWEGMFPDHRPFHRMPRRIDHSARILSSLDPTQAMDRRSHHKVKKLAIPLLKISGLKFHEHLLHPPRPQATKATFQQEDLGSNINKASGKGQLECLL